MFFYCCIGFIARYLYGHHSRNQVCVGERERKRASIITSIYPQRVEPWKLYVMVGFMVVVDIVVLGVWQGVDPLQRKLEVFPLEVPKNTVEDIKIKPELEHCESHHNTIWLGECCW